MTAWISIIDPRDAEKSKAATKPLKQAWMIVAAASCFVDLVRICVVACCRLFNLAVR